MAFILHVYAYRPLGLLQILEYYSTIVVNYSSSSLLREYSTFSTSGYYFHYRSYFPSYLHFFRKMLTDIFYILACTVSVHHYANIAIATGH